MSNLPTTKLIKQLKNNNQDFEWYPTTSEMIDVVVTDLSNCSHPNDLEVILDIGAGDGRVLTTIYEATQTNPKFFKFNRPADVELQAIEKSLIHVTNLPENITFIGGDFNETQLASKTCDVIFCNPPYSSYEFWATQIIKESFCKVIYLVIPSRWKDSDSIENAITFRDWDCETIYTGDFLDADRSARAKVDIIRLSHKISDRAYDRLSDNEKNATFNNNIRRLKDDTAFDMWFDEAFPDMGTKKNEDQASLGKNSIELGLVPNNTNINDMVYLYQTDMETLINNYKLIEQLDQDLFLELNCSVASLKKSLSEKMKSLKMAYWKRLFDVYEPIRSTLTRKYSNILFNDLNSQIKEMDFNVANAYILTETVIKRATNLQQEQIVDFYRDLSNTKSARLYKSNKKVFTDNSWRYQKVRSDEGYNSKFSLDYRIVDNGLLGLYINSYCTYGRRDARKLKDVVSDIVVISKYLGVTENAYLDLDDSVQYIDTGIPYYVKYTKDCGKVDNLAEFKFYKNGNVHLKMNVELTLRLNVTVSKILKWVSSVDEVVEEMDLNEKDAKKVKEFYPTIDLPLIADTNLLLGFTKED